MRLILAMLIALMVGGCSEQDELSKLSSPEDRQLCERLIADLQNGRGADFSRWIAPELRPVLAPQWPAMHALMPPGPARLVDAEFNYTKPSGGPGVRNASLAYEVDQGARHVLVRIMVQRTSQTAVTSFYVSAIADTVENLTGFGLTGKSAAHYAMLLFTIAAFTLIIVTLVLIVRTPGVRRKWLWFLGSLLGIGQIAIDWRTGEMGFNPLSVQVLGAFVLKPGAIADWQIGFGVPVVAIIFLIRRRRLRNTQEPDPASVFS